MPRPFLENRWKADSGCEDRGPWHKENLKKPEIIEKSLTNPGIEFITNLILAPAVLTDWKKEHLWGKTGRINHITVIDGKSERILFLGGK